MKRMIGGILVATALFSLAACGGNDKGSWRRFFQSVIVIHLMKIPCFEIG